MLLLVFFILFFWIYTPVVKLPGVKKVKTKQSGVALVQFSGAEKVPLPLNCNAGGAEKVPLPLNCNAGSSSETLKKIWSLMRISRDVGQSEAQLGNECDASCVDRNCYYYCHYYKKKHSESVTSAMLVSAQIETHPLHWCGKNNTPTAIQWINWNEAQCDRCKQNQSKNDVT